MHVIVAPVRILARTEFAEHNTVPPTYPAISSLTPAGSKIGVGVPDGTPRSATSGPASTSTPRTGLLADDCGELLAGRLPSIARASADHADDVEPGVIGASPAGVAAVGGRVTLQRVADDIRSRLAAATRQSVHGAFHSRAQPDGH